MRLEILHELRYRYEPAVFLEPFSIRLRPRVDAAQDLHAFDLAIDPTPAGRTDALDTHGNVVTFAWFQESHEYLTLTARSRVQTRLVNPFDYIVTEPGAMTLPVDYSPALAASLAPFRETQHDDPATAALAATLREEAGGQTAAFLQLAVSAIHEQKRRTPRRRTAHPRRHPRGGRRRLPRFRRADG